MSAFWIGLVGATLSAIAFTRAFLYDLAVPGIVFCLSGLGALVSLAAMAAALIAAGLP